MKSKKFVWTVYKPPLKEEFSRWRKLNKKGYIDTKDKNGKSITEHRLVMEKAIGRYLRPEEIVHHRGTKYPMGSIEDKQDNRIENLMLFANSTKHLAYHRKLAKERNGNEKIQISKTKKQKDNIKL